MRQPLERPPKVDYTGRWGKVQEWWDKQKRKWCVVAPYFALHLPGLVPSPPPPLPLPFPLPLALLYARCSETSCTPSSVQTGRTAFPILAFARVKPLTIRSSPPGNIPSPRSEWGALWHRPAYNRTKKRLFHLSNAVIVGTKKLYIKAKCCPSLNIADGSDQSCALLTQKVGEQILDPGVRLALFWVERHVLRPTFSVDYDPDSFHDAHLPRPWNLGWSEAHQDAYAVLRVLPDPARTRALRGPDSS